MYISNISKEPHMPFQKDKLIQKSHSRAKVYRLVSNIESMDYVQSSYCEKEFVWLETNALVIIIQIHFLTAGNNC